MTKSKNFNFKIASDGEITAPNYLAAVLPSVTVRIESGRTTYRFNGSYDGSKSLPEKLLVHMAKESEKESEKR